MAEAPTTPDPAERSQYFADALDAQEFERAVSIYAGDAVFSPRSVGALEGREAIRGFLQEWRGAYEHFEFEWDEVCDLGHGVALGVYSQRGRLPGAAGWVQERAAVVTVWADGLIQRSTAYTDIDEARAAAERLAKERG